MSAASRLDPADALSRTGQAEAVAALRAAASRQPDSPLAQYRLGVALSALGQFADAATALEEAVRLRPAFPEALSALAAALREQGRLVAARGAAERAIGLDFARSEAHVTFGNILYDQGHFAAAAGAFRRALGLKPGDPKTMSNLGNTLYALGKLPEACAQHRAALEIEPDSAQVHYNNAIALLAAGEFEHGWAEYEWRLRLGDPATPRMDFGRPRWSGEKLAGRTVFLYGEQGLGDTLQFVRFAPLVAARGGKVLLAAPAPLVRLFARVPGVERVVGPGVAWLEFDLHCPLLSLPHVLGTRLATVPAAVPYLAADPALVAAWSARLPRDGELRVGLVWAGNPRPDQPAAEIVDRRRSMLLARFAPLAEVPGVRYVSLQKGPPSAQLQSPPPGLAIIDRMDEVEDFADTAALIAQLDLVISVDTSVAHLAGAVGKPVWLLSRYDACWRWLRDRADSPWYPTLRIYRQPEPGNWHAVIERVVADLITMRAEL